MKKETNTWIYLNDAADTVRYVLGEKSDNMVACIGINPSTARPNALDNTLKSVKRIACFNGFDGWVMYNVYPQRATDPIHLHGELNPELQQRNNEILNQSIRDLGIDTIWVAYGDLIEIREYLPLCMLYLYNHLKPLGLHWKIIAGPTKKGHPKHPLYKPIESLFIDIDMEKYVKEILKLQTTKYSDK